MNEKRRVLDIDIERYVLGELPADRAKEIAAALASDPEGHAKLSAIEADNAAILEAYPPHLMAVQIAERAEKAAVGEKSRRMYLVPLLSVSTAAAAVVLAMVLWPGGIPHEQQLTPYDELPETTRIKGKDPDNPSLFVYRHGTKGEERLTAGQTATVGDLVQLKYSAKGQKYGVIFSVDGRGTVTLHFPSNKDASTALAKGVNPLDSAYELDDAPNFERFFFVTSNKPINVQAILDLGRTVGADGQLALSKEYKSSEFFLKKK